MDLVPVSIVVPAFNEAHRLPAALPRLTAAARRIPGAELIVVDDGSTDGTVDIALALLADVPGGRVVRLPWNCGKGTAIRVGVSYARGEAIVFMDADMASDPGDLPLLLAGLVHAEVVLGSRRLDDGDAPTATRTACRRFGSWAFNRVTRTLTSLDVADTQCGFKAFRGAEAKILLGVARATGFGFDVEVLAIARSMGYRIVEVPVRWSEVPGGSFRVTRHTPAMLMDVIRSRRHRHRRRHGNRNRLRHRTRVLPVPSVPHTQVVPAAGIAGLPPSVDTVPPPVDPVPPRSPLSPWACDPACAPPFPASHTGGR